MVRCFKGSPNRKRTPRGQRLLSIGLLGIGVMLLGCGSDHAPVSGVVTFNGEPVPNATVTFKPRDGGKFSFGVTDASGAYALKVAGATEGLNGARVGEHDVKIIAIEPTSQGGAGDRAGVGSLIEMSSGPARLKYLLPSRYHEYSTSGLEYRVVRGGHRDADFALSD